MKPATIKALKASIRHWEKNVERAKKHKLSESHISADKCPLCKRFINACVLNNQTDLREYCPIAATHIGFHPCGCSGTPWVDVMQALNRFSHQNRFNDILSATKKELKFLKSLLPKK